MSDNTPLSILLESAKGKIVAAFNEVLADTRLPAYLVEGIVLEILADVRNQKNLELMTDYATMQNKENKE